MLNYDLTANKRVMLEYLEDELTYLTNNGSIYNQRGKVASLYRNLSKCLKEERSASHPERSIGQTLQSSKAVGKNECNIALIDWVVHNTTQLLKLAEDKVLHYFMLCLLLDTLKSRTKCLFKGGDDNFGYGCMVLEYLLTDKMWSTYCPSITKAWDIINYLASDKYLGWAFANDSDKSTSLEKCLKASISIVECFKYHGFPRKSSKTRKQLQCDLIKRQINESLYATCFKNFLKLTNQLAKYHNSSDIGNMEICYNILQGMSGNDAATLSDILSVLSCNDQDVIDVLLCFAELELRNTNVKSEIPLSIISKDDMITSTISLFIWWVQVALVNDSSLLFDLVTSPETLALEYLLRATKSFIGGTKQYVVDSFQCVSRSRNMSAKDAEGVVESDTKSTRKVSVWLAEERNIQENHSKEKKAGTQNTSNFARITAACWDEQERLLSSEDIARLPEPDLPHSTMMEEFAGFVGTLMILLDGSKMSCPFDPTLLLDRLDKVLVKVQECAS